MNDSHHHHTHNETCDCHKSCCAGLHKNWRFWLIVALMLAGIAVYVLTLDDSTVPAGPQGVTQPVPASAPAK
jgi:hypothetical protein